jgi:uncharacterized protein (DUF58 family)
MILTWRTVGLQSLIALSALIIPGPVVAALFVAVLTAAVADSLLVRGPIALTTDLPPILSRGVPTEIVVEPAAPRSLTIYQPATADLRLDHQQQEGRLRATVLAVRRGRHRLPAPITTAVGPLGLGGWRHRAGSTMEAVVYPDMPAARQLAQSVRLGRFREEGRRTRGPLGLGTDLESIREYLPDDDIRQINWSATARLGTPMSNTYRVEQDREVMCLLDTGRLMAAPVGDRTRLDAAVDAVAAMAAVADTIGDRIGVVAFADRILRRLSPRRDGGEAVVRAIFDLEPRAVDSDYELAFRVAAASKRAFVLILTDIVEETAARPLLQAMAVLARHHSVTVAWIADPDLHRMVATPAETVADAYRTAVAVEVMEGKEKLRVELTHHGAATIEATPETFSARCVAAYLRAKARARL